MGIKFIAPPKRIVIIVPHCGSVVTMLITHFIMTEPLRKRKKAQLLSPAAPTSMVASTQTERGTQYYTSIVYYFKGGAQHAAFQFADWDRYSPTRYGVIAPKCYQLRALIYYFWKE